MRYERCGVDCKCARCLDGVRQLEAERAPQSRGAFGDIGIEFDNSPRLENSAVTRCERFVAGAVRTGQYLRNCDRCNGKAHVPSRLRDKSWHEAGPEFWMAFKGIDNRRRIEQEQRLLLQTREV